MQSDKILVALDDSNASPAALADRRSKSKEIRKGPPHLADELQRRADGLSFWIIDDGRCLSEGGAVAAVAQNHRVSRGECGE